MTWVAAGVASGAATMAGVKYIKGRRDAKKDAKNRPKYEIPAEISQNLTQAQQQALQGLPEEQKQQYLSNLQRGSAQALASSQSRRGGLTGIASLNQEQNDAYGNLMAMDSQARVANQDKLMGARQTMADYKDQAFQFNKVNPYYEGIKQRRANDDELFQSLNSAAQMGTSNIGGGGGSKKSTSATSNQTSGQQYSAPNVDTYKTASYNAQDQPVTSDGTINGNNLNMYGSKGANYW